MHTLRFGHLGARLWRHQGTIRGIPWICNISTKANPGHATSRQIHSKIRSVDMQGLGCAEEVHNLRKDRLLHIRQALMASLRDTGFVYLHNTNIQTKHITSTLQTANMLFDLADEEKASLGSEECSKCYYRYTHEGGSCDTIEAFNICNDSVSSTSELRTPYFQKREYPLDLIPLGRSNTWPEMQSSEPCISFRDAVKSYWAQCRKLTECILTFVEIEFGVPRGYLLQKHSRGDDSMELKKYRPLPPDFEGSVRISDHSDLSTITILIQDSIGGLQILDRGVCEWVDVDLRDGVLINTGDFLQQITNGMLASTRHRVIATKSQSRNSRTSVVFFATPNWDAFISPLIPPNPNLDQDANLDLDANLDQDSNHSHKINTRTCTRTEAEIDPGHTSRSEMKWEILEALEAKRDQMAGDKMPF
ncbi:hypothetical protein AAMO2058_001631300 [Amorphochlora amoebiformis]